MTVKYMIRASFMIFIVNARTTELAKLCRLIVVMFLVAVEDPVLVTGEDIVFPRQSGLVNVQHAPYYAKGDGITDDTAAINLAIQQNIGKHVPQTLYFPNGTYLVSDRLTWKNGDGQWKCNLAFQGQSRDQTVVKLKDHAEGYGKRDQPRAVIYTASMYYSTSNDPNDLGEGNEAFYNFLQNLTIDTGDNPGAIGIDYLANNIGAIRDVNIRGHGAVGLSMQRYGPGPCLIKHVEIEGFDYGIKVDHLDYGITLEHIVLRQQQTAGIHNRSNVLSMRRLTSLNAVPVIVNADPLGLVVLIDGEFDGGAADQIAILNKGGLYARNVVARGYRAAIERKGGKLTASKVHEYASDAKRMSESSRTALHLPIEEVPELPRDPLNQWANVRVYGAQNETQYHDDTLAIQRAIDSGRTTIYLPPGYYQVRRPLLVRGKARRIFGLGARISVTWDNEFNDPDNRKGLFTILDGESDTVEISGICEWDAYSDPNQPDHHAIAIDHRSSRDLVLKDVSWKVYRNEPESGSVFFENVVMGHLRLNSPSPVWARQLNLEASETKVINYGTNLWILGLKTEIPSIVIETRGGGKTELLGGLIYPVLSVDHEMPAFLNVKSSHSLSYATTAYAAGKNYRLHALRTIDPDHKHRLHHHEVEARGYGSMLPLVIDAAPETPGDETGSGASTDR